MKTRYWWSHGSTEDFDQDVNFIWTSWKREKHINYLKRYCKNDQKRPLKIYARLDNNKQLTNKKGLFMNMREYYTSQGNNPFDVLPLTFLVKGY
jgi:hypothetical protein